MFCQQHSKSRASTRLGWGTEARGKAIHRCANVRRVGLPLGPSWPHGAQGRFVQGLHCEPLQGMALCAVVGGPAVDHTDGRPDTGSRGPRSVVGRGPLSGRSGLVWYTSRVSHSHGLSSRVYKLQTIEFYCLVFKIFSAMTKSNDQQVLSFIYY